MTRRWTIGTLTGVALGIVTVWAFGLEAATTGGAEQSPAAVFAKDLGWP